MKTDYPYVFLTVYKTSLFPLCELICTTWQMIYTGFSRIYVSLADLKPVIKKKFFLLKKKLQNPNITVQIKNSHVAWLQYITCYIMINRVFTKWKINISKKIVFLFHKSHFQYCHKKYYILYFRRFIYIYITENVNIITKRIFS